MSNFTRRKRHWDVDTTLSAQAVHKCTQLRISPQRSKPLIVVEHCFDNVCHKHILIGAAHVRIERIRRHIVSLAVGSDLLKVAVGCTRNANTLSVCAKMMLSILIS